MEPVTFSPESLQLFEAKLTALNEQLSRLHEQLASGAEDATLNSQLAATNADIQSLRQQWRAMLNLPPAKN